TDPSYCGQIVALTVSEVGNYGVNEEDPQSGRIQAEGLLIRSLSAMPSNWRSRMRLTDYLQEAGIPALTEVDTRALTRHIRSAGARKGILAPGGGAPARLAEQARRAPDLGDQDLVGKVTCAGTYRFADGENRSVPAGERIPILAYDLGMKRNILRRL